MRYGLVIAKEHTHLKAMQEVGLQENWTIENLGKHRRKCLKARSSTIDQDPQHIPHLSS